MAPNLITLSPKGSEFIRNFEGFREFAYLDSGGLATIGWGTRLDSEGIVKYKDGIKQDHALALFNMSVSSIIRELGRCPFNGFQEWQYDAVISLAYNIGYGAFASSTIYKQLCVRSIDLTSWLFFCRDNKDRISEGLQNRRRAELKLFIYSIYGT